MGSAVWRLAGSLIAAATIVAAGCSSTTLTTSASDRAADPADIQDHGHGHAHGGHDHHAHDDHDHAHPANDPHAPCICAARYSRDIWCRRCNVGYIATQRVDWPMVFDALDPHGHVIDFDTLHCAVCVDAVDHDAFCDDCGMGFVDRKTYFSRLSHGLAGGRPMMPTSITCSVCRGHLEQPGWCDACDRGMVGNVALHDPDLHARTAREFALLQAAIDRAPQCELCAAAMVVHRTCPTCLVSYEQFDPAPRQRAH